MVRYVSGFVFTLSAPGQRKVALIEKDRPNWQVGYWNAIGGKIEVNETPRDAMAREFWEEAGYTIPASLWTHCLTLTDEEFELFIFRYDTPQEFALEQKTSEKPAWWLLEDSLLQTKLMPNTKWLLSLAAYDINEKMPYFIQQRSSRCIS